MTPITKQQVAELIDRLADKTLSFGCQILWKAEYSDKAERAVVYAEYRDQEHFLGACILESDKPKGCYTAFTRENIIKNYGHPILLGDVLEKMSKQDKVFELREVCKFLEAWEMCVTEEERAQGKTGFTKSLQEIAEGIEWVGIECSSCDSRGYRIDSNPFTNGGYNFSNHIECGLCLGGGKVAKPSPETNLFIFLKEIGL